ncbi:MAG: Crp/Fnr family transcriptional regulator [Oscillatoria sp. PMC 1051.18]|uniref:Crp/Fnr family transcriptional regulator n=1 Tax=Oscillatoria salina TaxID=331517 RepID=UPI0013BA30DA|nr:Crp/Fnr family transcriptional regulator [Oscillatoria salina]MBZ8182250.1 Crp/Fnr family transcriptional regulator [Oscillatoria salina IIICB1]MEC4895724.1 Crp/Fnr family transcriptional regulator [Oscillatoria sp. PMC 1050.18]MEC5032537.1 Crp/Fnr family transcriptional regulator [Oscillatoria sp. PMC 1051.18]NET90486.1 Crp/Fnr family transcriptional regulator [Kamptonema sp. SIO1D9]
MALTANPTPEVDSEKYHEGRRLHFYHRGDEIPLLPEGVWQVYRGVVQLSTINPGGEEVVLGWAQPTTYFGLWLTCLQSYRAKALSDVYIRWFSQPEIESSPNLAQVMVNSLSRRTIQTEAMLAIAGQRRVEERLQQLLLLLKQELGQPLAEGVRLEVRLTHQNIANAISTTRVTVTRLLGDFQRRGYITIDSDRHIILTGDRWESLAH